MRAGSNHAEIEMMELTQRNDDLCGIDYDDTALPSPSAMKTTDESKTGVTHKKGTNRDATMTLTTTRVIRGFSDGVVRLLGCKQGVIALKNKCYSCTLEGSYSAVSKLIFGNKN